jgi:hypothetical protein
MRNLIGVADGVKLSESAPLQVALAVLYGFLADFFGEVFRISNASA